MAKRSFWESLGRGVAHGWQKTKELSSQISDKVEGKLELEKARDDLDRQYRDLGELAAEALLAEEEQAFTPESPEARELLESIGRQRGEVERLRREREEQERQEAAAQAKASEDTAEKEEERRPDSP